MRYAVLLLMCVSGCIIPPLTAEQMYGRTVTENQGLRVYRKNNEFVVEATANTEGRVQIRRDAESGQWTELDVEINSKGVDEIMKAKAGLVESMGETRLADLQRVLGQQKIVTDGEIARFNRFMDTVDRGASMALPSLINKPNLEESTEEASEQPSLQAIIDEWTRVMMESLRKQLQDQVGPVFGPPSESDGG